MGEATINTSQWKLVEVGRVVLFNHGPYSGRLATIVEIIDHKRVRCWDMLLYPADQELTLEKPSGSRRRSSLGKRAGGSSSRRFLVRRRPHGNHHSKTTTGDRNWQGPTRVGEFGG